MAMWTLILKNSSGSDRTITDLGITITNGSQVTMSDLYTYDELAGSDDLRDHVNTGNLVVNDGTSDLSSANGVEYLILHNRYESKDIFYTKTNLQTSGQSSVHWDNIVSAPSFGSATWLEPAIARVVTQSATPPGGASTGDFYIDTDDDHLYKYNGATWDDQGAPSSGDRVIVLDSTAQMVFEFSGSTWDAQADNNDLDAILIDDDGDGKQAQYVYNTSTLSWIKIADVDYGEQRNLDESYDDSGSGAGRVINTDAGAVKLDTGVATNSPLELTEKAALPSSGLAAGQLAVKGGILFVYDSTRSKWLSVQRQYIVFGRKGNTSNQYLNFAAGSLPSNNSGYRIPRDACIISMTAQLDASGTADFRLRRNDSATNISTISVAASLGATDATINVDISANDFLQMYSDNASSVNDPMIIVEIAYRG